MNKLKVAIEKALQVTDVHLEHPAEASHGDFATNIAMVAAKGEGKNPRELAEQYVEQLIDAKLPNVEKIEVAGPGFINFYMDRAFFVAGVAHAQSEAENYGRLDLWKGQTIVVEHSSPNLFKPFHIGHLMNNAVGESAARLAEFMGADIVTSSFPSDVSLGIGKAVWAFLEKEDEFDALTTDKEKLEFLGECYTYGTSQFEADEAVQARVREITTMIYEDTKGPELEAYAIGKELTLKYFEGMTERLGSSFDGYIFETESGARGREIVKENTPNVFTESDGAVVYAGDEDKGLHTRVFINSAGYPTYEAKDLGLVALKFEKYNPDRSVIVTDHEQGSYFKVVRAAAGEVNPAWDETFTHLTHGRMTLAGQRMSSRLGGIPLAEDILNTVRDEVHDRSEHEIDLETADMVGAAALKYTILRNALGKSVNFDPEQALSFEGDSGPYIQYTFVRTQSILNKAKDAGIQAATQSAPEATTDIERLLYQFPEVVETASNEFAPHYIVTYVTELASAFNSFYAQTKIVDAENPHAPYYIALTEATGYALKNALYLLGIKTPSKM